VTAPWPAIEEPELLARLATDHDGFTSLFASGVASLGPRTFTPEVLERALRYPWSRPARSYVLEGGTVRVLHALGVGDQDAVLERYTGAAACRTPLLAFGSNGAPETLVRKFAHFDAAADRDVLVLAGHLHDFDVGASSHPTLYGSMPATLFPSPGTAVRCATVWVTPAQFTQLAWSELSYGLGRLTTRFEADEPQYHVEAVIGFVSRFGAFSPGSAHEPVALAAIPARRRRARPFSQEHVLDHAARIVLGPGSRSAALVRRVFEDYAALWKRLSATLHRHGVPFRSERWTPFPGTTDPGAR
jgi:hypothetical protein